MNRIFQKNKSILQFMLALGLGAGYGDTLSILYPDIYPNTADQKAQKITAQKIAEEKSQTAAANYQLTDLLRNRQPPTRRGSVVPSPKVSGAMPPRQRKYKLTNFLRNRQPPARRGAVTGR